MPKRPAALLALTLSLSLLLGGVPLMRTSAYTNLPAPNKGKKSCASCPFGSRGAQAGGNAADLSTLGRRTQPQPLLPIQVSAFEGARLNFVGTSDGNLAFAVNDLELSGPMPLFFQRVYASDRREDTGLGAGWSFVFDDRVTLDDDSATLMTGTGAVITFRRAVGGHFVPQTDAPGLHQSFDLTDGETISEQAAGLTRTYRKLGGAYRLARIADPNDNSINISFDDRGNVSRIASGRASLSLEWSGGKRPLLLSVADSAGRRVSFRQAGQRLRAVTDAAGAEWSYGYAGGRLTRASDPVGRVLLRARYDDAGRAVEAGDAAGAYLFEYEAAPDAASRRTTVTDPAGAKTVFTHNGRGALTAIADEEGQLASSIEYNAANRPARVSDSLGNEVTFAYDSQNRLLRQRSSDGAEKSYTYDERGRISSITDGGVRTDYTLDARGNVSSARGGDPSDGYEATRNARGQLISLASRGGRTVSFGYDAAGNRTAVTFSDVGRFKTEYDSAGRMVAERLPSGLSYAYKYDARGALTKQSDNEGHSMTLERDASGALVGVASADGRWVRAARDRAGRIVALSNSSGKSRRYEYDARGSLTGYTDARGKHRTFTYDRGGRLRSLFDSDGASVRYDYDRAGHLIAASRAGRLHTGAARLMPTSYEPPGLSSPAQDEFGGCLFGGDGWFDGDTFYQDFGMGCDDPFGGFGDSFGDPFGSFFGETCAQCKARQLKICQINAVSCVATALGVSTAAAVACVVITDATATLQCLGIATLAAAAMVLGCYASEFACELGIPDRCPMC